MSNEPVPTTDDLMIVTGDPFVLFNRGPGYEGEGNVLIVVTDGQSHHFQLTNEQFEPLASAGGSFRSETGDEQ